MQFRPSRIRFCRVESCAKTVRKQRAIRKCERGMAHQPEQKCFRLALPKSASGMPTDFVPNSVGKEGCLPGPTGRDSTAQGASALGKGCTKIARALKGRDSSGFNDDLRNPESRPGWGFRIVGQIFPQLDALGCRISPRWGCLALGRNKTGIDLVFQSPVR
jgi:hypothetical protein